MRRQISRTCAQEVGQLLMDQNLLSVNCRYEENQEAPATFDWQPQAARPTALEGLHAVDCYEYQSSADPAWLVSEAYAFCGALRAMLVLALPGYREAAGWEWREEAFALTASPVAIPAHARRAADRAH